MTASVMVTLGLTMHTLASGPVTLSWALVPVVVAALLTARAVQGDPGSVVRTATLLLGGQVAVHVAASPAARPGGHLLTHGSGHEQVAMAHGASLRRSVDPYGPKVVDAVAEALACLPTHPSMLAGHLVAAAALGWWLASGERQSVRALMVMSGLPARGFADALVSLRSLTDQLRFVRRTIEISPTEATLTAYFGAAHPRRGPPAWA